MADRFPGRISIGGSISATERLFPEDPEDALTVLEGLILALHEDGACDDYGGAEIPLNCSREKLNEYIDDDGTLTLVSDQARNGEFEETESFCIKHGLSFDRWSDHYCEYDSEIVFWRPDMEQPLILFSNADGDPVIRRDSLEDILAQLEDILDHPENSRSRLLKVKEMVEATCRVDVSALEPFVITE